MLGSYYPGQVYPGQSGSTSAAIILLPFKATHGHTVDAVTLAQQHSLSVAEALHAHTADALVILQHYTLTGVADATHAHTADAISITQAHLLAVADALHTHTVDAFDILQKVVLAVQDALHGHTVENLFVYSQYELEVQDTFHNHTTDEIVILIKAKAKPIGMVRNTNPSINMRIVVPGGRIDNENPHGSVEKQNPTSPDVHISRVNPINIKVKP